MTSVALEASKFKELGCDPCKAWATGLFYHDPVVKMTFVHKGIGIQNLKNKDPCMKKFMDEHVKPLDRKHGTLWFCGKGSKFAAEEILKKSYDALFVLDKDVDVDMARHFSGFVVAHDCPTVRRHEEDGTYTFVCDETKKTQGTKMYGIMSPWQFLAHLNQEEWTRKQMTRELLLQKPVKSVMKCDTGTALNRWFCTSLYNPRFSKNHGDYAFTIDVDGKHCMTKNEIEEMNETAAKRVIHYFEKETEEGPPRLANITNALKICAQEAFANHDALTFHISWHKSSGWKPSWRGYAVGLVFSNIDDAKAFMQKKVVPYLALNHEWYNEGIVDASTYCSGFDRCLGSAKFEVDINVEMRYLQMQPLFQLTDKYLVDLFQKCPNEYVLRCLGMIYAKDFKSFVQLHESVHAGFEGAKKKKWNGVQNISRKSVKLSPSEDARIVTLVSNVLREKNFISEDWNGYIEKIIAPTENDKGSITVRAVGNSTFCIFKHHSRCRPHENTNGKQKFCLKLPKLNADDKSVATLNQKCFACEGGDKFKNICSLSHQQTCDLLSVISASPLTLVDTTDKEDNDEIVLATYSSFLDNYKLPLFMENDGMRI